MCARLRWLAERKASQIESITTSRWLILNSPHEHCYSGPSEPLANAKSPAPPDPTSRSLHLFITAPPPQGNAGVLR